jgi:hypothetical protein
MRTCIAALHAGNTGRKRCHVQCSDERTIMADNATDSLTTGIPLLRPGLRIAADSCSLIFLNRLHLLETYAEVHTIVLTQVLYDEIMRVPDNTIITDDRAVYTKLFSGRVLAVPAAKISPAQQYASVSAADCSLIHAYETLRPDGILTDDKGLCLYCRNHAIPYINSPMALFVLLYNGHLMHAEYATALQTLYDMGRYGRFVHDYMERLYLSYCACANNIR